MNGEVETVDSMLSSLDSVLLSGRLKQSDRRELEKVREELMAWRSDICVKRGVRAGAWAFQIFSLFQHVVTLLDKFIQ